MNHKFLNLIRYVATERNKRRRIKTIKRRFRSGFPGNVLGKKSQGEAEHKNYWKEFNYKTHPMFYRAYSHYSKCFSAEFIPDDLFHLYCLPALNMKDYDAGYSDHYFVSQLLPEELQCNMVFRNIEEVFYNCNHEKFDVTDKVLHNLLRDHEEIILKPSLETDLAKPFLRFKNIHGKFLTKQNELLTVGYLESHYQKNFIVELPPRLHPSIMKLDFFNLTALRFYLYRSPVTEKINLLGCCFIEEKTGFNETDMIKDTGIFLVDEEGHIKIFNKRENDKKIRQGLGENHLPKIPKMTELIDCSRKIAEVNYYHRVIAIDLTLDEDEQVKFRGIRNHTFDPVALQFAGKPFFGNYTDEIAEFCSREADQKFGKM